ncbi:hypothetical protein BH20ACI2_BH20ACI2_28820 [soil metagenome]
MPKATIYYHDIGDYLKRDEKLAIIKKFGSVTNESIEWTTLAPNEHGDWISQRNDIFNEFIPIGDKTKQEGYFVAGIYCRGLETSRDAWAYNFGKEKLGENVKASIDFYNDQREKLSALLKSNPKLEVKDNLLYDDKKISWSRAFVSDAAKNKEKTFDESRIFNSIYRPFTKEHVYFSRQYDNMVSWMDSYFPKIDSDNVVLCVGETSVFVTDQIPDLHLNGDTQCLPLYYYKEKNLDNPTLFDTAADPQYIRRDGISDWILKQAHERYGKDIKREDIFYYVYGFLHSPEYRIKFANDLKKMLPRIPLVESKADFVAFSKAGRALAQFHLNYEKVSAYPDLKVTGEDSANFRVGKMRFANRDSKDAIQYNSDIVVSKIPAKAYEYVINGKSAIEWIMERYQVKQGKPSGIINDPNHWSEEVENERYILDLLLSIVNVSVQTVDIVSELPTVKFD